MAYNREPLEITALKTNREVIIDTVGDNLQWFAGRLVAKAFIADKTAQGILTIHGITTADKASQLMNSVFTKINGSDDKKKHWFCEFVNIFDGDRAYQDLVEKLRKAGITLALTEYLSMSISLYICLASLSQDKLPSTHFLPHSQKVEHLLIFCSILVPGLQVVLFPGPPTEKSP